MLLSLRRVAYYHFLIMNILNVGFLQLTSGAVGVAGFLEGVKNAVTGFNNVLKLM